MAKHKYIETPEKMWGLFTLYRKDVKDSPIRQHDFVGKDADSVHRDKERPLTLEGFENYVEDLEIVNDLGDYFSNKNNKYKEFSTICSRIRRTIKQDQIEGGMVGIYNPSITQRLNGLADTQKLQGDSENPLAFDITLNIK